MRSDEAVLDRSLSRSDQVHAVTASFLGWTLDAFDFFVLVFLVDTLAAQFHVPASKIILTITATLAMRPLGALLFGVLADRYGRRGPLMANVVFFSVMELACGFAPNYTRVLRAAGDLRNRNGRRVGCGCVACDGERSGAVAGRACRAWCRAGTRSATCWRRWRRG